MKRLLAVAGFIAAMNLATPAMADSAPPRTLSLTGHGEMRIVPDLAVVSVGVTSSADTAAAAVAANTTSMTAVLAALAKAGIATKDIQTANFSVQPRYDYGNGQAPRLLGYDVANTVTVNLRDLAKLGSVLDQAVTAGSNQVNGISFQTAKPDAALDEARKLAVADAARKAALFAAAGSVSLGNILSISEAAGTAPPVPMQAKIVRAEGAADVPIAQGEQVIAADVNIVWEIK
ncbi:MAG: SIMPL domain-containing protein [Rhizobiales bacterium]|nr:SIMPL domain-containing protein [Hyphomicrobiales bacterium]